MNRFSWLVAAAMCWAAGADVVRLTALPEEPLVHWAFEGTDFDLGNGVLRARGTAGEAFALDLPETGVVPAAIGWRGGGISFSDRKYLTRQSPAKMPDGSGGFTIALWAAPTTENSGFISWGANATAASVGLGLQSGELNFFLYGGGDLRGTLNTQLYSGTWHHFAAVYDPDADADAPCHVYVDGAEVTLTANTWTRTPAINLTGENSYLCVGSVLRLNGREFAGGMDELMVFNRALTAEEIGEVMRMNGGGISFGDKKYPILRQISRFANVNDRFKTTFGITLISAMNFYRHRADNLGIIMPCQIFVIGNRRGQQQQQTFMC